MPLDRATLASSGRSVDPSPLSFPSSDPPSEYSWAEEYQRLYPRWKSVRDSFQFDAARLDVEMSAMLKEQLVKVFSLMKLELGLKDLGFLFPKRYGIALPQLVGNIYGPVSNHSQLFADGVILNRSVMVDFDRCRPLPGGISLTATREEAAVREKEEERERGRRRGRTSTCPDSAQPSLDQGFPYRAVRPVPPGTYRFDS
ncbi:hypothetical protein B296_00027176 [Ensete ventricosum]|uniref:Uncharacterized protein n=1 Tax=Ensete ventricosum TaxID=4639 RepID=A0A426Y6J8_ENSVE|nr:hypothetical protein B296_00027176 [Ensete ventricosum]